MKKRLTECTVLVVDDTEVSIDLLLECLGETCVALVAKDGKAALDLVAREPPDLILLDIMMPEMDGYEVCRHLKEDEATRDIPIIFVTSMGDVVDETRGLALGAVDYITKPFSPPIVRARVENHLVLKLAQEDLREQHHTLEESYERLRELETLRDNLTHMIVHDMRSPLAGIRGCVEIVLMTAGNALKERATEQLKSALEASDQLVQMINSVLDVSRLEAGQMQLSLDDHSLRAIAGDALTSLGSLTRKCHVAIEEDKPDTCAHCDAKIIRRVIANLVANALKCTPKGGRIAIRMFPAAHRRTRVEICDTGEGISPEYHARIFEKFGQVQNREKGKKLSTGLGLTFCKLAVEAHGGEIGVTSDIGEGSTFWFTLPPPANADREAHSPSAAEE